MTSTQSLLYAAPSDITIDRVRTLVRLVGPEAPTVEYKEKMAETIAKGVAALANTYGGLMLVGVTNDTRIVKGVKEKTIESVAEHCAALIEPPYVPEIIPVPLGQGSDLYVLVLRVVPGQYPRPLLVEGVAPVRHQNTTHPADWQRLRDLFTEPGPGAHDDAWDINAPDLPLGADGTTDRTVDFVIRTGLGFTISREAKWRPLREATVTALIDTLNQSQLHRVLRHHSLGAAYAGDMDPFHRQGLNRSRTVRLAWWGAPDGWPSGRPGPIGATVNLEVPGGYGQHTTHLSFRVDVTVQLSAIAALAWQRRTEAEAGDTKERKDGDAVEHAQPPRWRVTAQQLGELIDALLATLTSAGVVEALAQLGQIDRLAVPQPRVMHMRTERPVTQVLDTAGLRPIRDAGVSRGAHLLADPTLDLADPAERREQVEAWLAQIALDAGLLGMERLVQNLTSESIAAAPQ